MIELTAALFISQGKPSYLAAQNQVQFLKGTVLDQAMLLENMGFKKIQLIDLDGVEKNRMVNNQILQIIKGHTSLHVDFGGGITDDDDIRLAFESGADQITAAALAKQKPESFASWVISYGRKKMILAADAENGKLIIEGPRKRTETDVYAFIKYFDERGILHLKTADFSGKNVAGAEPFAHYKKVKSLFPELHITVGGGISSLEQIQALSDIGMNGVIVGRAIYEDKLTSQDLSKYLS